MSVKSAHIYDEEVDMMRRITAVHPSDP